MTQSCLVCNSPGPFGKNYINNIFDKSNVFPSERKLIEILSDIIDTQLEEDKVHSKIICKECHKTCSNYDQYKTNADIIKSKLSDLYHSTQEKTSNVDITEPVKIASSKVTKGKFVVPASKLQPLPADFQLNLGKIAAMTKSKILESKPLLNLKLTIGDSVLTQSLASSTVKILKRQSQDKTIHIGQWNTNNLPSEIFSNNENESYENDTNENDEMNEDCKVSENDPVIINSSDIKTEDTDGAHYINSDNFELLLDAQEDDEQEHTIVLDSNNSILQMMSGQKLVYDNGELSLVVDENDGDDMDGQDSNDEDSQIELQVSGDEETANAIIAAAQEQGGAFIKVESGEMYRVKSVQSKPSDVALPDTVSSLVIKDGDHYRCLVCENSPGYSKISFVGDASAMVEHMKQQHAAKVYICGVCGIIMRNRAEYSAHMTEHVRKLPQNVKIPRSYTCEVCKKSYNSRTLLQEHTNLHTGERPYACDICDKTFASKYTRQAHLKTHEDRPRPYICPTCSKAFLSQQNLTQHEKIHLGVKNFICHICNKAFSTQHSLEAHGVVHVSARAHACPRCDKAFARRAELQDHARTHTGERPFECEVCGAKFSQRSNLHTHRRATHLNDKRHACPTCPKKFKRRRLLQYHIKAAHTGERPLKCDVCHSTFVYPEHYKKHLRIHNGERPYYCEICGKAFNSRDNRNTHRFVHSDKKPYECLACGASYMRKRMLVAHMNANGHLAESIVVNQPRVTKVSENIFSEVQESEIQVDDSEKDTDAKLEIEETENEKLYTISVDDPITGTEPAAVITPVDNVTLEPPEITDENDSIIRFIQVKMPDGNDGWVALND